MIIQLPAIFRQCMGDSVCRLELQEGRVGWPFIFRENRDFSDITALVESAKHTNLSQVDPCRFKKGLDELSAGSFRQTPDENRRMFSIPA